MQEQLDRLAQAVATQQQLAETAQRLLEKAQAAPEEEADQLLKELDRVLGKADEAREESNRADEALQEVKRKARFFSVETATGTSYFAAMRKEEDSEA